MKRITKCKSGLSLVAVLLCFILQSNAQEVLSLETENCRRGGKSESGAKSRGFHEVSARY